MTPVRIRSAIVLLVLVGACTDRSTPITPPPPISTTVPPTVTTAEPSLEVVTTGCSAPPITFALLCEVVGLIDEHHLSPPGHASLAAAATSGVSVFTTGETAEVPRSLTCAVPSGDFNSLCDAVAWRLRTDPVPIEPMIEVVVEQMLTQVLDPYSTYVPPELSGALSENGVIGGAGIVIEARNAVGSPCVLISSACPLQIELVIDGGPGDEAGLSVGDQITAVGGTEVDQRTVLEVAAELAGSDGQTTNLTIVRDDQELAIALTHVIEGQVSVAMEMVGNTGYLRLAEFGFETHLLVHFALASLLEEGADRLILDLRDNPGGFLFSVSIIGSEFVSDGLLYRTSSPAEQLDYPAIEGGIATRIPITVLVNESSASSAEILAAALRERSRATVVGTPTFGKNLVQDSFELRNGGILRLTTAEWTTPEGTSVAGTGVQPDVVLELPGDLAVEKLIDLVLGATS